MAQTFSSRDDLKRDPLQEWLREGLEWVARNRQTFFSIVGTAAVAAAIAAFMVANFRDLRRQAWERYSSGQNWVYANQPDNALKTFNEVIANYGRTPAAVYSLLAKGDVLYGEKKSAEAVAAYQKCLQKDPPRVILPFVLSSLGAAQEDAGDFNGAVGTYKRFLADFPDHYLSPMIYEALARSYETSLNPDAAKEIYEKIVTMFPGTPWAEKARARYQALAPRPFATPDQQAVPEAKP